MTFSGFIAARINSLLRSIIPAKEAFCYETVRQSRARHRQQPGQRARQRAALCASRRRRYHQLQSRRFGRKLNSIAAERMELLMLNVLAQAKWVIEGERGMAKLLNLHPNTLRSRLRNGHLKKQ